MITLSNWLPSLIGMFTLYGGGGKGGDMPDSPDMMALANQQFQNQLKLNRSTTQANRINQYTPWGSIEYFNGSMGQPSSMGFSDSGGYSYSATPDMPIPYGTTGKPTTANNGPGYDYDQFRQEATNRGMWLPVNGEGDSAGMNAYADALRGMGGKGSNKDQWSSVMKLNPELQKILENEWSAKQQGYGALQDYLGNIKSDSLIPRAPINAGMTAQQAIMDRLNPTFNTDEENLRTRLMNQGVRAGSEAWDNEFRNFERRKNDAFSQAALQGISLDNDARARALAEQGLPLNAIQSFLSGQQVQAPNFTPPGQQANTAAPDLMGAAQAQYGNSMNAYNAQQAQGNNFMSGLFGLGGSLLGGPAGGALGGAIGGFF
jgi:hypothetical protein